VAVEAVSVACDPADGEVTGQARRMFCRIAAVRDSNSDNGRSVNSGPATRREAPCVIHQRFAKVVRERQPAILKNPLPGKMER
jgi:hypothetical protein